MLSMHSEDTWVHQALDAGAHGYILKSAVDMELVTAIRRVVAGEIVLDPQVSRTTNLKGEGKSRLTVRELEVLKLIVAGKSNKEIAID
jgi:two-component system, NarL family, nitrate/nitrite response regulator NarL